jgi:lambda repressor-like predicted transcriptional regulator
MSVKGKDYVALKWGTLKAWKITSKKGLKLLKEYGDIGSSMSAALQKDTPRQKQIICELIDTVPGRIYLEWDGKYVSKITAKEYVREYGKQSPQQERKIK